MYNVFTHDKKLEIQHIYLKSKASHEKHLLKTKVMNQTLAKKHEQRISPPRVPLT